MAAPTAVLFDLDGTLIDSTFLHVEAWDYAFTSAGLHVPAWRTQQAIGADTAHLLGTLLGSETSAVHEEVKTLHDKRYKQLAPRLKLLPGAQELITTLADHGVRVVLATSARQQELDRLLPLLDMGDDIDTVTSAEDAQKAKPAPDIISVALDKAGVDAASAIMVGDSIWDITAATAAGIPTVAVASGGTGKDALLAAGAIAVFDDAADLLDHVGDSPLAALWSDRQVTS